MARSVIEPGKRLTSRNNNNFATVTNRAKSSGSSKNQCFSLPLVGTATGGKGGGGAQITDLGREILHRYREMERKTLLATEEDMAAIRSHLTATPPENPH